MSANSKYDSYSVYENGTQIAIAFIKTQNSVENLSEVHITSPTCSIDELINTIKEKWPNIDVSSFLVVIFPELKAFQYNSQDVH